ncbi:peptidase M50 [Thermoleophilia bacterium SCSIO 60948]|nr:peptidase M50 [Thermoleophilia bacterium SCSIO 60948]
MSTALAIGLAILGVIVLVVLHELGHFFAAKAVGMRVEKLYLFFGKGIVKVRRGETEYGIGWIPAGGYAKISGMNPDEELPPEVAPRGYYNQPVWKRIVVILAGPAVNLVVAFLILWGAGLTIEEPAALDVGEVMAETPAAGELESGDRLVSVAGVDATGTPVEDRAVAIKEAINEETCAGGRETDGCEATRPVDFVVQRDGEQLTIPITPRYDAEAEEFRVGFGFQLSSEDTITRSQSIGQAAASSADQMWLISSATISTFAQLFKAEKREQLGSVVGAVEVTRQAFQFDIDLAIRLIGFISLSLALVNLLPFLPLDGGHVFWAIVEKLRGGRRVSFEVMERASVIGFALVMVIFFIGLSNDIGRFSSGEFDLR